MVCEEWEEKDTVAHWGVLGTSEPLKACPCGQSSAAGPAEDGWKHLVAAVLYRAVADLESGEIRASSARSFLMTPYSDLLFSYLRIDPDVARDRLGLS